MVLFALDFLIQSIFLIFKLKYHDFTSENL